jgi:hypothetical protein
VGSARFRAVSEGHDEDEPLPPLPLERGLGTPRRALFVALGAGVAVVLRLAMLALEEERAEEHPPVTMRVIDDPYAGLWDDERRALERAIRSGRPLQLDSSGRLRPAESVGVTPEGDSR